MTLIMVMHSLIKTNILHCYNKSYKIPTGVYTTPLQIKEYQISTEMDIETMPHAMYFSGNTEIVTKINHVPYQTVQYDDKGMFLMGDTPIQVYIDNGATPSILPISTYNKCPVLQKYQR